ncbi:MAG TPA: type II toxin-antitoxin system VapC family toxin [Bryobacteraceae bacterium]|nr:type II toxin-antitoxin system VapC family toxin [Bryobacteraceae bacterium]
MSRFLLDTNIISELIKPKPEAKLTGWVESADEDLLYLSVLTVGEIGKGIAAMEQGRRSAAIQSWGETDLKPRFSGRVLPIDEATAARWGAITGAAAAQGITVPVVDGLLAATALQHNLTLVTRNTKNLAGTNAPAFNPWDL